MTPNEAAELMRQSQIGGVATSAFDAGGGYAAVKKLAEGNTTGYQAGVRTGEDMAKYAPNDAVVRFDPAGQGGLGETFYASGNSATGRAGASSVVSGYSGLAGAKPNDGNNLRTLVEASTGRTIDNYFYDQSNPNYAANQAALSRASKAMYGDVGANIDARNWSAIMAAADPLKAAEDALKVMYNDKAYLAANTDHVLAQGYLPEQADLTYKQMSTRVGSTYDPNWSKGTKYEGKYDTTSYLNNIKNLSGDALATYENTLWTKWGGNPRLNANAGVVNTGTSTNSTFVPATTTGQITGTSNTTPGATTGTSAVTGGAATGSSTVTPGSTGGTGLIAGATTANSTATSTAGSSPTTAGSVAKANTQTLPTQLNASTATGGGGLLTGANTLTPGTFNIPNTATGNVNDGGLISGVAQQLSTQNAQVGLPTGVTPRVGVMGNNTGGESITAYNPYGFTGANTATGNSQNWYNSKTGQRYTAPAGTWAPPSADWARA